jgi:hypothetical protein
VLVSVLGIPAEKFNDDRLATAMKNRWAETGRRRGHREAIIGAMM